MFNKTEKQLGFEFKVSWIRINNTRSPCFIHHFELSYFKKDFVMSDLEKKRNFRVWNRIQFRINYNFKFNDIKTELYFNFSFWFYWHYFSKSSNTKQMRELFSNFVFYLIFSFHVNINILFVGLVVNWYYWVEYPVYSKTMSNKNQGVIKVYFTLVTKRCAFFIDFWLG